MSQVLPKVTLWLFGSQNQDSQPNDLNPFSFKGFSTIRRTIVAQWHTPNLVGKDIAA